MIAVQSYVLLVTYYMNIKEVCNSCNNLQIERNAGIYFGYF